MVFAVALNVTGHWGDGEDAVQDALISPLPPVKSLTDFIPGCGGDPVSLDLNEDGAVAAAEVILGVLLEPVPCNSALQIQAPPETLDRLPSSE